VTHPNMFIKRTVSPEQAPDTLRIMSKGEGGDAVRQSNGENHVASDTFVLNLNELGGKSTAAPP